MRVLVIDDEPLIARLVEVALSGKGVEVTTATTAGMGVATALDTRPDVILLDLHLPDGPGEILLDAVADVAGWSPRIVIFSALEPSRIRAIADRYAVEWLPKPFELDDLRGLLSRPAAVA